ERGPGGVGDGTELEAFRQTSGNVAAMKTSGVARGRRIERELAVLDAMGCKKVVVNPGEGDIGTDTFAHALDHGFHREFFGGPRRVKDADDVILEAMDDPVGQIADVNDLDGVSWAAGHEHHTPERRTHRPVDKAPRGVARSDDEAGANIGHATG